jgi:hypothetical protein
MEATQHIHYFRHDQLDKNKWDKCIELAPNGLIYAYSFYLDHMAKHWDGLVLGDYEAVMPLTWNRKYGIHYLYQPFLTAQLGVFGKNITSSLLQQFLNAVPKKFRYWDIYLNHQNVFAIDHFELYERSNFVLTLNRSYELLQQGYRENIRRNVRKSEQVGCRVEKGVESESVIRLAIDQMRDHVKESKENVERFRKLNRFLEGQKMSTTYGIYLKEELMASCIFFYSHKRAYYILVGNHPNGKTIGASHALIDAFIKDHAGKDLLLDFEGSDIRNLAFFYSSFGAVEEKYSAIKLNRLPFYLKWLKGNDQ